MPASAEAEAALVGAMLSNPKVVGEVVGTLLASEHFYVPAFQTLYGAVVSAYYADEQIDPLTIGTLCAKRLSGVWGVGEHEIVGKVRALADANHASPRQAIAHARLVKRTFDYRELMRLCWEVVADASEEEREPEELAGQLAQRATQIATSTLLTHELVDFETLGRRYIQHLRTLRAAREAGLDVGIKCGLKFMDDWTRGLRPGYLYILAGEPGMGKSSIAYIAVRQAAERQLEKPEEKRTAILVLSLEMVEEVSSARVAQNLAGIDGGRLQEGDVDDLAMSTLIEAWKPRRKMPLIFNFSSAMRASQMRALIAEAVRRYRVGWVVIDHMRYFHMDDQRQYRSPADEDEAKAVFLKEAIAKDLGVAVMCLAHTTKGIDATEDRRPRLSHLRGGGMVAGQADFVSFLYQPYKHAPKKAREEGSVLRTDAELIYAKNRHNLEGTAYLKFDPSVMEARDRIPT